MYDIYANAENDLWRFWLGRGGNRTLFTIGLNPSIATKEKSDTTIAKVDCVAKRTGFDGFVMLNLYPVRATDYNALPQEANHEAFSMNLAKIEELLVSNPSPVVWVAWGENILARKFLIAACRELFDRFEKYNAPWQHFGPPTRSGHPRHPSRLHYKWEFAPFDMRRYLEKLGA